MPQHDSARPYGLRQPAAFAGHGRDAAELRFGDDAAPSFILPLARHQQDSGVSINASHVEGSIAQLDIAEAAQPSSQARRFGHPKRPGAHEAERNVRT